MRFADRLFFVTTAVLTVSFAVFGAWMLSSYFQKLLNRELEQVNSQSQLFQYLFELSYQSMEEYGSDFAVSKSVENVVSGIKEDDTVFFAFDEQGTIFYHDFMENVQLEEVVGEMYPELTEENNYICGFRRWNDSYYLMVMSRSDVGDEPYYLGICRDLTTIYEDRQSLLNQYRVALISLLVVGGICIYLLSRYMTRPIRELRRVAGQVAVGDYAARSQNHGTDEIGELAAGFNHMADRLVEQMRESEREAERKALEAKQKEDFTAAFAHELKTPLTSIIGYADMLNSVELTEEERREAYYYIYNQGKRLESLSYKLMELISMEKQEFISKPIRTRLLEENLHATMRPIWQKKKIRGKVMLEKGIIYGDYELLLSLLYNLLDNAGKAVEEGGFILMKGMRLAKGYEIRVIDNGRGIPREEIHRITEAFYMVDKSRARKEGGAGIGMALCERIIKLHGGTMAISSRVGEGTVIQLVFPGREVIHDA